MNFAGVSSHLASPLASGICEFESEGWGCILGSGFAGFDFKFCHSGLTQARRYRKLRSERPILHAHFGHKPVVP